MTEPQPTSPNHALQRTAPRVTVGYDGIDVTNVSVRPIFLVIMEREYSTLADVYPCTVEGPACRSLAPGQHRLHPWASIGGYAPSKSAYVVIAWSAGLSADGLPSVSPTISVDLEK